MPTYDLDKPLGQIPLTEYVTDEKTKQFIETGICDEFDFGERGRAGIFEFPAFFTPEQCADLKEKLFLNKDQNSTAGNNDPRAEYGWPVNEALEVLLYLRPRPMMPLWWST